MPFYINLQESYYMGYTALMLHTNFGTKEVMEWLLTRQPTADANIRNRDGKTAIKIATEDKLQ